MLAHTHLHFVGELVERLPVHRRPLLEQDLALLEERRVRLYSSPNATPARAHTRQVTAIHVG